MQVTETSPQDGLPSWLRLAHTPGLGPVRVQRLLAQFGTPQAVLQAPEPQLAEFVPAALARLLTSAPDDALSTYINKALAWQAQPGNRILTLADPAYPALLRQIADPPVLLYCKGRTEVLAGAAVAIVGSRNATAQGVANARAFARALGEAGITVVSGMALGIDAAAHEGALGSPGSTVAVVGTGADRIYPRRNDALARRLADEGCLLSEYPLGMGPLSANFPKRNRLISGLCSGVLVIEAAAASGSLITAHVAIEQGRDVYALPGSIHAPLAKGCHKLIKEGAALVDCIEDLLLALHSAPLCNTSFQFATADFPGEGGAKAAILLPLLSNGPIHADALAALAQLDPGSLASELLALELAGLVERLPGGSFQRLCR